MSGITVQIHTMTVQNLIVQNFEDGRIRMIHLANEKKTLCGLFYKVAKHSDWQEANNLTPEELLEAYKEKHNKHICPRCVREYKNL